MWLDTKLETITRLQTKPGHMYTFVCAQEFRRDEFAAHSKGMRNSIKYYFEIYNDITIYYTYHMHSKDYGVTAVVLKVILG